MNNQTIFAMNKMNVLYKMVLGLYLLLPAYSCSDDDPPLPDNVATFESAQLGLSADEDNLTIKVKTSRAVDAGVSVTVSMAAEGVSYGTDFTTTPAASGNSISLIVPQGSSEASFVVARESGALLDGDETITFTISDTGDPLKLGTPASLVLSFSEILAEQATVDADGGGATYSNKVFIDLSANRQTPVERTEWDLGFYMDDDFRVILNSSVAMLARPLDKTDLNDVTAADTVGFAEEMVLATPEALPWVDDPTGDLENTAIAEVSASDSENKVYIINRGDGIGDDPHRGWKKVRVIRNGSGYTVQHADINATTFEEIQVEKDDTYLFRYVLFESGTVDVEPARDKWDIAWTFFMNSTYFGPEPVPYTFQDMIIQNRYGVATAKVLTSTVLYENFSEADLEGLTFTTSQTGIGSDWRVTSPPPPTVHTDRFYVVKDADGNYFKLKFNLIVRDGVRGNPQFEYALVKAGE